jgi:hypothetical protein
VYANASWFDVGFYMDRNMDVYGFLGYPLFGWVPQQAWTGTNNVNAQPPALGACCAYNVKVSGTWTPSTALLTPAQVIAGNAASTVYSDFIFAAKER